MVKIIISKVDNHVVCETNSAVRIFDDIPTAIEYVTEFISKTGEK